MTGLRRNWLFVVLFALGAALRVVTAMTLSPALWNSDSHLYLRTAFSGWLDTLRPSGYGLAMRLVPDWTALWTVTALQHCVGLGLAVAIYVCLLRWRVPRWGAALAAAPVLLDPLQISLEHYILADAMTEFLVVAACLVLIWRPRFGLVAAGVAGALLGIAATTRSVATALVVVALGATLLSAARRWVASLVLVLAFLVPFGVYATAYHNQYGSYSTTSSGPLFLYGRVGLYVDCVHLKLPADERVLCPTLPVDQRTMNSLLWAKGVPSRNLVPPPGQTRNQVLSDFDKRAIEQQPLAYLRAVTVDTVRGFYPTRHIWHDNVFDRQWRISTLDVDTKSPEAQRLIADGVHPRIDRRLDRYTTWYSTHVYTPGIVLGLCLVAGLLAAAGLRRARPRRGERVAAGFLCVMALATMVIPAATASFSWRYQIEALALLPIAAAIGLTAILRPADPDDPGDGPDEGAADGPTDEPAGPTEESAAPVEAGSAPA